MVAAESAQADFVPFQRRISNPSMIGAFPDCAAHGGPAFWRHTTTDGGGG